MIPWQLILMWIVCLAILVIISPVTCTRFAMTYWNAIIIEIASIRATFRGYCERPAVDWSLSACSIALVLCKGAGEECNLLIRAGAWTASSPQVTDRTALALSKRAYFACCAVLVRAATRRAHIIEQTDLVRQAPVGCLHRRSRSHPAWHLLWWRISNRIRSHSKFYKPHVRYFRVTRGAVRRDVLRRPPRAAKGHVSR